VDIRGRAADEHAIAEGDDPIDTSVVHDGHDRIDGTLARKRPADRDQYSRRVQFAARLPRESVGTAEAIRIEADFTGTDCQLAMFTG
jgi:hypothetical protein